MSHKGPVSLLCWVKMLLINKLEEDLCMLRLVVISTVLARKLITTGESATHVVSRLTSNGNFSPINVKTYF